MACATGGGGPQDPLRPRTGVGQETGGGMVQGGCAPASQSGESGPACDAVASGAPPRCTQQRPLAPFRVPELLLRLRRRMLPRQLLSLSLSLSLTLSLSLSLSLWLLLPPSPPCSPPSSSEPSSHELAGSSARSATQSSQRYKTVERADIPRDASRRMRASGCGGAQKSGGMQSKQCATGQSLHLKEHDG